jgi:hypothetical protein
VLCTFLGAALGIGGTLKFVVPAEKPPSPSRPAPTVPAQRGTLDPVSRPRILKLLGSRKSYVLRNGIASSITTGGDFICIAEYLPIEYDVSDRRWARLVTNTDGPALCPLGLPPFLRPELIRDRYLLVERDQTRAGDPPKEIWLLHEGRLVRIPANGPTFACLAKRDLVWDYVSARELNNFTRDTSRQPARCR